MIQKLNQKTQEADSPQHLNKSQPSDQVARYQVRSDLKCRAALSLEEFLYRHGTTSLLLSSGKDSMACLALLLEFGFGDRVTAVHIDTGAELPEVHEVLERIRPLVRDVVIVRSDVKEFIKWNGLPTDLVVADNTTFGKQCSHTTTGARVCDKYSCCKANIWDPWMYYAEHCEDTGFIVGDKRHDAYGRMGDEMTFGNKKVEVCHPIKDWSDEDVLAYLYERDFMFGQEKRMSLKHSSFDCWCCSAYWEVAKERLEYLEEFHKDLAVLARRQYEMVRHDAAKKLAVINNILEK